MLENALSSSSSSSSSIVASDSLVTILVDGPNIDHFA
jgi:hypothetical protein